jgi:hypothetical protein
MRRVLRRFAGLTFVSAAVCAAVVCGCGSAPPPEPLDAALTPVPPADLTPAPGADGGDVPAMSADDALAAHRRLLTDIRLYLTAITGGTTGSTHPTLQRLEAQTNRLADGLRALRAEMRMNGLEFANSMQPLIEAIEAHYRVLEQIRDHLAVPEAAVPPSSAGASLLPPAATNGTVTVRPPATPKPDEPAAEPGE